MTRFHLVVLAILPLTVLAGCASTRPQSSENTITSVAFSPDHSLLAFADGTEIRVLELNSRKHVSTLRQLPGDIEGANPMFFRSGVGDNMVFLDNARIASTGMGGLVSIWDVRSGRRLSVIDALSDEAFATTIDYSQAANRLIIGTSDGLVFLSVLSGNLAGPLMQVANLEGYVRDLQFGEDGRYFASASEQTPVSPGDVPGQARPHVPAAGQIDENSSGANYENIPALADRSNVAIWDAERLEKVGDLEGALEVTKMALVPGERALLTAGEELRIWEFLTLQQAGQIRDPNMVMQGIGIGTLVAVSILGIAAGAALGAPSMAFDPLLFSDAVLMPAALMYRPNACLRSVAVSPDGQTIVSTTRGPSHNVMAVIDRASDKVIDKWTADFQVCDMEFSADGNYLLTATSRGGFIYDTSTWKKTNLKDFDRK